MGMSAAPDEPQDQGGQEPPPEGDGALECPSCGQCVDAQPSLVAYSVECPACGQPFIVPSVDGSTEIDQVDEQAQAREQEREHELDALRMRHIVGQKRAAMRSRTYAIAGAVGCVIGGIKLVLMAIHHIRARGWEMRPIGFILAAGLAVVGMIYCIERASHYNRESRAQLLPDPDKPPDFSTLGDGNQRWKNLEDIR